MLFGDKTNAIFDIWSFEHFLNGIVLAFILKKIFKKNSKIEIVLLISFIWECLEHYLEEGLLGSSVKNWFAGEEYWGNRLIGDGFLVMMGYIVYNKYNKTAYVATILTIIFFITHLFFPSSMDIQKYLFN